MSLVTPLVRDGLQRDAVAGDLLNLGESVTTFNDAGNVTLTAAQIMCGIFNRTGPAGAFADTTPTAAALITALLGQTASLGSGANTPLGINPGTTFRWIYKNSGGGTMTLTAGTNVSLVGTTTVATTVLKEYLVTIINGTPSQVFAASTTNASAVITGLDASQTSKLSPGMAVSGTGIAANSIILSIQPGVGVTLDQNATATGSLVALTFAPRVSFTSLGGRTA